MKFHENDYHHPGMYSTDEDRLDVNFRSIVSDCRGLISGTLVPRSLGEFSEGWRHNPARQPVRMRKMDAADRYDAHRKKVSDGRTYGSRVTRMARILHSTGTMSMEDARTKAQELLRAKE